MPSTAIVLARLAPSVVTRERQDHERERGEHGDRVTDRAPRFVADDQRAQRARGSQRFPRLESGATM